MSDDKDCKHMAGCAMYQLFTLSGTLAVWQNHLVAGLSANATYFESAVIFSDGGPWKTFDMPVKHTGVYCLLNHEGSLYAGTWNRYLGKGAGAKIFKLTAKGWHALDGEGHASDIMAGSVMVMTLTSRKYTRLNVTSFTLHARAPVIICGLAA